jgi:hypothetical protein
MPKIDFSTFRTLFPVILLLTAFFGLAGLGFTCSDLRGDQAASQVTSSGDQFMETATSETSLPTGENGLDPDYVEVDLKQIDTDNDGLSDYEEIYVYGTDPENADTDGDGYLDGAEVLQGYNPRGRGTL